MSNDFSIRNNLINSDSSSCSDFATRYYMKTQLINTLIDRNVKSKNLLSHLLVRPNGEIETFDKEADKLGDNPSVLGWFPTEGGVPLQNLSAMASDITDAA